MAFDAAVVYALGFGGMLADDIFVGWMAWVFVTYSLWSMKVSFSSAPQ